MARTNRDVVPTRHFRDIGSISSARLAGIDEIYSLHPLDIYVDNAHVWELPSHQPGLGAWGGVWRDFWGRWGQLGVDPVLSASQASLGWLE